MVIAVMVVAGWSYALARQWLDLIDCRRDAAIIGVTDANF
jgi:hypothetical protein